MLSSEAPQDLGALRFPVVVSEKIDGVRCTVHPELGPVTRSLKPVRNRFVHQVLSDPFFKGMDGELVVGEANHPNCMQNTTSGVMSFEGKPDFKFYVFDHILNPNLPWRHRYADLKLVTHQPAYPERFVLLEHQEVEEAWEIDQWETSFLEQGFEGLMIRDPNAAYKFGRSTTREGFLLKLKRFLDDEAEIVGFEEEMHNANELGKNELGYAHRTSHQENLVPKGTLGKFIARSSKFEKTFKIGSGFTAAQRQEFWNSQESLKGKIVKYKYLPIGVKERPRHPIFLGFRHPDDM